MSARYTPLDGPAVDDPQVGELMRVYDSLLPDEQRQVFLTLCRAIAAYRRSSDIDHLVAFAESIEGMVRLDAQPGYRQAVRDMPESLPEGGEGISLEEAVKRLRE